MIVLQSEFGVPPYPWKTGFQGIAKIDSSSLDFPRGAPATSKRSILDICEHCEQGRNKAENQNTKSIYKQNREKYEYTA